MRKILLSISLLGLLAAACQAPDVGRFGYVCSADARMCSDGSYVGRTGPNCEFSACPDGRVPSSKTPSNQGCVDDVKKCSDGSYVGRSGPNCEFAACPVSKKSQPQACTEEARLCPDGSAVGRTGPNCTFPKCPGE